MGEKATDERVAVGKLNENQMKRFKDLDNGSRAEGSAMQEMMQGVLRAHTAFLQEQQQLHNEIWADVYKTTGLDPKQQYVMNTQTGEVYVAEQPPAPPEAGAAE